MALVVFLLFSLLQIRKTQGSAAESKFVKLGADVGLDVKKPVVFTPDGDLFFWKFNRSLDIFRSDKNKTNTKIYSTYHGRVVVLKNFSFVLKNVQEPDAGLYTAVLSGNDNKLAEYKLHIQAAVSPVKLEVVSLFADSDSCNLTVTCRTNKAHLNATNQVSEMKEAKALQQVCRQHVPKEISSFTWIWIPLVFGLALGLALIRFALRSKFFSLLLYSNPEGVN
uniref:Uncharacterized LOC109529524 n=1 Tax=Hippocampus comes TaxID=109280 RepID=A0A3Q3DE92_HIPCM